MATSVSGDCCTSNIFFPASLAEQETLNYALFNDIPAWKRFLALIVGFVTDFFVKIADYWTILSHKKDTDLEKGIIPEKEGLVVMLHGVNGHPCVFHRLADALRETLKGRVALYYPKIEKKGNCSVGEASAAIIEKVHAFALKNPKKPISFLGVSRGTRIAVDCVTKLLEKGISNPFRLDLTVGPLHGTKMMNQPDAPQWEQRAWKWITTHIVGQFGEEIREELSWGSESSKRTIADLQAMARRKIPIAYYGTVGDGQVTPVSCFPMTDSDVSSYHLTEWHGHQGAVRAFREMHVEAITKFILTSQYYSMV